MKSGIDWEAIGAEVVFVAENGIEVKEYLSQHSVDILILDIEMPGLSGIDIARWVHENNIPSKVIFLTAYSEFQYAQMALSYGVAEYVLKEDYMETLVPAVSKVIASVESRSDKLIGFVEKLLMQTASEQEKSSFLAQWKETAFLSLVFKLDSRISFFEANTVLNIIQKHFEQCNIIIEKLSVYEYLCIVPARCENIKKRCCDIALSIEEALCEKCKIGIGREKSDISMLRESFLEAYDCNSVGL